MLAPVSECFWPLMLHVPLLLDQWSRVGLSTPVHKVHRHHTMSEPTTGMGIWAVGSLVLSILEMSKSLH